MFLNDQPGWDSNIAVPFRLLEELPDNLARVGPNEWSGTRKTYEFKLGLKPSRIELLVRNSLSRFVEHHTVQVNGISSLSAWSLVDRLIARLERNRESEEVFVGDIVSQLHILRSSSRLVLDVYESAPSLKASEAIRYVSEAGDLPSDAELRLTLPFELWSESHSDERPVWSGYRLPGALDELAPTMVTSFNRGRLVSLSPASVPFDHEPDESEGSNGGLLLSNSELDELDRFAAMIRERLTSVASMKLVVGTGGVP